MQSNPPTAAVRPPTSRKTLVAVFLLAVLAAFLAGTVVQEPLAVAGVAAGAFSLTVGIGVVAPMAGRYGKRNLMMAFAQPTPEDLLLIHGATGHIIANAGKMAEDPEMQQHFGPIFDLFIHQLDLRWKMTLKNIASQRERGAGIFNPENMGTEAELLQNLKGDIMERFADPILDSLGFEGKTRETARAYFMIKFMEASGGVPAGASDGPAQHRGSTAIGPYGNPGGGWGGV